MIRSLLLTTLLIPTITSAMSLTEENISQCNVHFTEEQVSILDEAYQVGYNYDLSKALQGIVIQESFVANKVIRVREASKYDTSFGVAHHKVDTAVWIAKKADLYKISPQEVKPFLSDSNGDSFSLQLAVELLVIHRKGGYSWSNSIARYNGGSYYKEKTPQKYLQSVKNNIKYIEECGYYGFTN